VAEEAHLALPPGISQTRKKSVFLQGWLETPSEWTDGISETEDLFWQTSSVVRGEVNKCLELARNDKIVGASVEAEAFVFVGDAATRESLQLRSSELAKFFLVSRVAFVDSVEEATKSGSVVRFTGVAAALGGLTELGVTVGVQKTTGTKCLRCWGYFDSKEMGEDEKHPELCGRCTPIVLSKDPGMDARVVKATMAAKAASEAAAEAAAVEAV
jgi:isoleucyl-tRNA synthetase